MPFYVPNSTAAAVNTATVDLQARLDAGDIQIMAAGDVMTGVAQAGPVGKVQAQASPDMTVKATLGTIYILGVPYSVAAASALTIDTADATYDRLDLIYVNSSGTISVIKGAASAHPVYPAIPLDGNNQLAGVVLAVVHVAAGATTITNTHITDKRVYCGYFMETFSSKGSIPTATAARTTTELSVGANGRAIIANSSQSVGLEYKGVSSGVFGDGSDGAFAQTTGSALAITGMTLVSAFGIETYTMNRDCYYTDLSFGNAAIGTFVVTAGYKLFVSGTLTLGTGVFIQNKGGDASTFTGGTQAPAGTMGVSANGGSGIAGGAGNTGGAVNPSNGAAGGAGGLTTGAPALGGAANGGSATAPTAAVGGLPRSVVYITTMTTTLFVAIGGAAGGGAGTSAAGTGRGGGGGAGGGSLVLFANEITNNSGVSAIRSSGGAGGAATAGNSTNVGGGGGGGGGGVFLVYRILSGSNTTYTAANVVPGGAGGAGVGTGRTGATGSTGNLITLQA